VTDADAFFLIELQILRMDRPLLIGKIAGAVGRLRHPRVRLVLEDRGIGAAVAARGEQLEAHVAVHRALVEIGVAFRAVGRHQEPAILIAHVADGVVIGRLGVVAQGIGAQELIEAEEPDVAFEKIVLRVGAADPVRIARRVDRAAIAFGRKTRDVHVHQVVLVAHRPVDGPLRTLDDAERAARARRVVRLCDAECEQER
jgi:hypothetical protein